MKRLMVVFAFVAATSLISAESVSAAIYVGDYIGFSRVGAYGTTQGGEFLVTHLGEDLFDGYPPHPAHAPGGSFYSFCLERNEYVAMYDGTYATTYVVDNIGNGAIKGGISGGNPDPISWGTAWIYAHYRAGDLGSFNFGAPSAGTSNYARNDDWTDAVQSVIWYLEGEAGVGPIGSLPWLNAASADNATRLLAYVNTLYAGIGGAATAYDGTTLIASLHVVVLNPVHHSEIVYQQSQLAVESDGGLLPGDPVVPEPATLAIWSLGLGIAGLVRLRRKS